MSMGYGARATLVLEDAETAIYTYGGFNWDIPSCKNPDYVQDGLLTIPRDCLPEPEIHARWRRMPSGKKRWVEKRVPVTVDVCGMIREGWIVVEDCSYCWVRLEEAARTPWPVMYCGRFLKNIRKRERFPKRYPCFPEMPGKTIFRTTPFRVRKKGYILRKC